MSLVLLLVLGARRAQADEIVPLLEEHPSEEALITGDTPFLLQPEQIRIPEVPADYVTREVGNWLRVQYPRGVDERVAPFIDGAEAFRGKLRHDFGTDVLDGSSGVVEVRIARNFEDLQKLTPLDIPAPAYASGVAYSSLRLVLITLIAPQSFEGVDVRETGYHELAHVALFDATAGHHVPRWLNEGIAIHESGEKPWERGKVLWEAAVSRNLLPLAELDRGFREGSTGVSLAYAQSADLARHLLRQQDHARFVAMLQRIRGGQSFESSLRDAYGLDLARLEYQWKETRESSSATSVLVTLGSAVWGIGALILVVGWVRRRQKNKQVLARWAVEEAAEDKRRAELIEAARELERQVAEMATAPAEPWKTPRVHHDGGWHTLH